jgi:uncharacterized SAM-binding protein YcdF (DUF218 family)
MRRTTLTLVVLAGVVAAVWLAREPLLSAAGRFLIVEDPLDRSDVIVVLSGGRKDERVRQAADLYKAGYAPRVLLSGGEALMDLPVPDLQKLQAVKHGIPETALLFESRSTSTGEQAQYLRPILEHHGFRRAIVVTSSYHTRRTRYLFRRAFAGSPVDIRVYPVQRDLFSAVRWWTREQDTEYVVLEYVKLGLALVRR